MANTSRLGLVVAAALVGGCGPSANHVGSDGAAAAADADTTRPDARQPGLPDADTTTAYPDASLGDGGSLCGDAWMCADPVDDGCLPGTDDVCDDGLDNDCNGEIDEGCGCTPGAVQPCFMGPPGKHNVGACVDGMQTCFGDVEISSWGPCTGGLFPIPESCDGQDNNCNGCVDDHPDCCDVELDCPGPGDLADGKPFVPYVLHGATFYPGPIASWSWTVVGGPCDQLLDATSGVTSYTLSGASSPNLTFTPTLSGDYTVTMTATASDGTVYTCTFIIHIEGPGLRVELCWDTTGDTDIDLHVHRDSSTSNWFTTTPAGNTQTNPDDCYYRNCKAEAWCEFGFFGLPCTTVAGAAEWGAAYPDSPLGECDKGPEGAIWTDVGSCHNPRLDIDNIAEAGRPENINVDVPLDGKTYRVMVQYYNGSVVTHPMVNVYCGGRLQATYGASPDVVTGFDTGGPFETTADVGTMWRVVDVTPAVAAGVTTGCALQPLHPAGSSSGYWLTTDDRTY